MSIVYRQEAISVVAPDDVLILGLDATISPTTLIYGVRTSFSGEGGRNRNFEFYPTHYGIGVIWGLFDGYVTHKSYIEFPNQYHFSGMASDSKAEPSFIYPDTSPFGATNETEVSKVTDQEGLPTFEYSFTEGVGFPATYTDSVPLGSPLGDFLAQSIPRMVMKSKNRLYAQTIFADTLVLEVFKTAKQPITLDIIQIR